MEGIDPRLITNNHENLKLNSFFLMSTMTKIPEVVSLLLFYSNKIQVTPRYIAVGNVTSVS